MRGKLLLVMWLCAATVMGAGPSFAQGPILLQDTHVIKDIENRPITFHTERFDTVRSGPILLVIDGSGCGGALREGFSSLLRPAYGRFANYAKLTLTKPGIDPQSASRKACTQEYRERYSLDSAVLDHLRVLQHLRSAEWWDGRLFVWGWSDGGDIGARLISYYPNVERAMLGAQGGGYTMAQHMEDFWECPKDRVAPEKRQECLEDIRGWFEEVRERPLASEGRQESHKLWRSRLFADLVPLLADDTTPLLIMHGAKDRDNTPVESARLLITRLKEQGHENLRYCEIPEMAHGMSSLGREAANELEQATLAWLFDDPSAENVFEKHCDPDPPLDQIAPPSAL
ncbi:MAG: prolyl oligopeptidase family serine peptidase [Pseudomonadota bacterium]